MFEQFPRVRILFENGGGADAGAPAPRFEADYPSWPVPGTTATPWYFGADGSLVDDRAERERRRLVRVRPVAPARHDASPVGEPERDRGRSCPTCKWNAAGGGNRARVRDRAARRTT